MSTYIEFAFRHIADLQAVPTESNGSLKSKLFTASLSKPTALAYNAGTRDLDRFTMIGFSILFRWSVTQTLINPSPTPSKRQSGRDVSAVDKTLQIKLTAVTASQQLQRFYVADS